MDLTGSHKVGSEPPPIFVVGPPRSGTTLTAKILGRHSRIFMPGETHFFDDICSRRRELGELQHAESIQRVVTRLKSLYGRYNEKPDQERIENLFQKRDVIEKLTSCHGYREILSCFMEIQMRPAGKERWGNNVPKDIFHIKEIMSFYPDAKIIVCIRDVRDFLLSYQNKWKVSAERDVGRIKSLYHPVVTSLLWKASVKQIARIKDMIPRENLMRVRYESLVQNPEKLVREICRFIGEDFEEDMLNVDEENSSFQDERKGIYSSSVERWGRLLTNEEAYVAQKITRRWLVEFGYTTTELKINPLKVGYMYATMPYGMWRAIYANRAIRGPLLPYLVKLLAALWQSPTSYIAP
jgi:Sulfotransferase family